METAPQIGTEEEEAVLKDVKRAAVSLRRGLDLYLRVLERSAGTLLEVFCRGDSRKNLSNRYREVTE